MRTKAIQRELAPASEKALRVALFDELLIDQAFLTSRTSVSVILHPDSRRDSNAQVKEIHASFNTTYPQERRDQITRDSEHFAAHGGHEMGTAEQIIEMLGLKPHSTCGFVAEPYRRQLKIPYTICPLRMREVARWVLLSSTPGCVHDQRHTDKTNHRTESVKPIRTSPVQTPSPEQ